MPSMQPYASHDLLKSRQRMRKAMWAKTYCFCRNMLSTLPPELIVVVFMALGNHCSGLINRIMARSTSVPTFIRFPFYSPSKLTVKNRRRQD
eukprot:2744048-Prymnesium_polylepis.2